MTEFKIHISNSIRCTFTYKVGCPLGEDHLRLSQSRQGMAFIPMVTHKGLVRFASDAPPVPGCLPGAVCAFCMSSGWLWLPPRILLDDF